MRGGLDDRAVARARSAYRRPNRGVDDKPAGAGVAGGLASHRRAMARHPSKLSPLHETGASHGRPAFCAPPHSVCCATRAPERRRERELGRKRGGGGRSGERGRPERRIDGIPFAHRSHHIRVRRPRHRPAVLYRRSPPAGAFPARRAPAQPPTIFLQSVRLRSALHCHVCVPHIAPLRPRAMESERLPMAVLERLASRFRSGLVMVSCRSGPEQGKLSDSAPLVLVGGESNRIHSRPCSPLSPAVGDSHPSRCFHLRLLS